MYLLLYYFPYILARNIIRIKSMHPYLRIIAQQLPLYYSFSDPYTLFIFN